MWLIQLKLVGCVLKRLFLQLYRPLRERRESLAPDRWLLLALLPPAAAVFVALAVCLLAQGQAGQFAVGGAIAILLAGMVYALLAIQASSFGPTVHNAEQALAALQDQQKALLAEIAAARSRSAARRPVRAAAAPPRESFQAMDSSHGAPTGLRAVFEFGGYALWSSVCFSPDSALLALKRYRNERQIEDGGWTEDHIVELWDLATGNCRAVLDVGNRLTRAGQLRFSPDGTVLAAARRDDTVQLFDVQSGRSISTLRQQHTGEDHFPTDVTFSPDGTLVAAAFDHSWFVGDDRHNCHTIDLWNAANARCIASVRVSDVPDIFHLWLVFCFNRYGTKRGLG